MKKESSNELTVVPGVGIPQSLRQLLATELFDGENKLTCDHCKKKQPFVWEKRLEELPPIITITAARAQWDSVRNRQRKNLGPLWSKNVSARCAKDLAIDLSHLTDFDVDAKIPLPKSISKSTPPGPYSSVENLYEPYAGVVHHGSATSGHYVALVNKSNTSKDRWYMYNDESVEEIRTPEALALLAGSSLLFYRRLSPQPVQRGLQELHEAPVNRDIILSVGLRGKTLESSPHARSISSASTATGGGGDSSCTSGDCVPSLALNLHATNGPSSHCSSDDYADEIYSTTLEGPNANPKFRIARQLGRAGRAKIRRSLIFADSSNDHIIASKLSPCKRVGEDFTAPSPPLSRSQSFPLTKTFAAEQTLFHKMYPKRDANDRDYDKGAMKHFSKPRASSVAAFH